jgi:hypothetical protein
VAKRYNLEIVDSETGEERTVNWAVEHMVLGYFRKMKEGDALVINRTEDSHGEGGL